MDILKPVSMVADMLEEASTVTSYALKIDGSNYYFAGVDAADAKNNMLSFYRKYYQDHDADVKEAVVYTVTRSGLQLFDYRII